MNVVVALEGVHKRFGANAGPRRRRDHAVRRRGPRPRRRERRRQVDADQDDDRPLPTRRRRDPHRRRARRAELGRRRPGPRDRRHLPGADGLPGPQRRREHLHGPPHRGQLVRWRGCTTRPATILRSLEVDVDPRAPASTLAVGAQQAVEIAKAMSLDARVLIMDEPTAALSAHEVERLFDQVGPAARPRRRGAVRQPPARRGVPHRRPDHRVPRRPAHLDATCTETNHELLVRDMVGREIADFFVRTRHEPGDAACASKGSAGPARSKT